MYYKKTETGHNSRTGGVRELGLVLYELSSNFEYFYDNLEKLSLESVRIFSQNEFLPIFNTKITHYF